METTEAAPFQYLQRTFKVDEVEAMVQAMDTDGFVLVPNALTPQEVSGLRAAFDKLKPRGFDYDGGKTHHFKNVFNQNPYFLQFIDKPGLIDVVEGTLGKDCHIIGQTAWRSYPGHNGGGGPHIDQIFFPMPEEVLARPDVKLPVIFATLHFYLSDITAELCPTHIIPGSHKSGRGPNPGEMSWNGKELTPVLCKAGDAMFFRSEVWHSGGLNATKDQVRYMLQVHYSIRNGSQHFSPFLHFQFNPEVLATANPRQLRLLGNHWQGAYD